MPAAAVPCATPPHVVSDPVPHPVPHPVPAPPPDPSSPTPSVVELGRLASDAGLRRIHVLAWRDLYDPEAGGS